MDFIELKKVFDEADALINDKKIWMDEKYEIMHCCPKPNVW